MPHDFKHASAEVSIYLIKSNLGLHVHRQAWGPLVYPSEGLCYSNQYPDIYRRRPHKEKV